MTAIGPYILGERIQEGAGTSVHRAVDQQSGTTVLLKVPVLVSPARSPAEAAELRYEYAVLAECDHAGVISALGPCEHDDITALVLQDLGGETLERHLGRQRVTIAEFLTIAVQLVEALGHVHDRGIIHKNLHPRSILVHPEAPAQLFEFDSAVRLSGERLGYGGTRSAPERLAYASPEQTGRVGHSIDGRSDLYSLGGTFYEMLTGRPPFVADDPLELMHCHIAKLPAPPRERSRDVPEVLSAIVMKLLSKPPEERYQSTYGLLCDLTACLERFTAVARIEPFELGARDRSTVLRLPQRLYGREAELSALAEAWERARRGATELVLIAGEAGVGKSALVDVFRNSLTDRRGQFAAGKAEQSDRGIPFVSLARAIREVLRRILAAPEDTLARLRSAFVSALGDGGRILVELLPELALIIGPQPKAHALGPTETQNLLALMFQRLFEVFTAEWQPLVLFLDDLHWVDDASLLQLKNLQRALGTGHLLVIGTFRANELPAGSARHDELRRASPTTMAIEISPLHQADTARFVADSLVCDTDEAAPLATAVYQKTLGNPFLIGQLFAVLNRDKLVVFDAPSEKWTWALPRIQALTVADDVASFMVTRLQKLPERTQAVLGLAACIGHRFDLRALCATAGRSIAETARDLWKALEDGVVVALTSTYRLAGPATSLQTLEASLAHVSEISYEFVHERVQRAAYSLVEFDRRAEIHLRIGRLTLTSTIEPMQNDDVVFVVAKHMNLAMARLREPHERIELARLNLAAGRKARKLAAYHSADAYFETGVDRLGPDAFTQDQALAFALYTEGAESACMIGAHERAEALFDAAFLHAASDLERAQVHDLRMKLYTTFGKLNAALEEGRAGLRLLGVELPSTKEELDRAFKVHIAQIAEIVAKRSIEALFEGPPMTEPDKQMISSLMMDMTLPALVDAALFNLLIAEMFLFFIRHGRSNESAAVCASYGWVLSGLLGRHREGYRFGKLALEQNEQSGSEIFKARTLGTVASCTHFSEPLRRSIILFEQTYRVAIDTGNLNDACYSRWHLLMCQLGQGEKLEALAEGVETSLAFVRRADDAFSVAFLTLGQQAVACLMGRTDGLFCLSDAAFDEDAFLASMEEAGFLMVVAWYYILKLQICYSHGDRAGALRMAEAAMEKFVDFEGMYTMTEHVFFHALSLAPVSISRTNADEEQRRRRALFESWLAKLAIWDNHCPENYRHKYLLVQAEDARAAGRDADAMELYNQAIESARANGFLHNEALASELCALFHEEKGRVAVARIYMTHAYQGYARWGAAAKLAEIDEKRAHLIVRPEAGQAHPGTRMSNAAAVQPLDAASAIKVSQALSGEVVREKLLARVMSAMIENAGAERGALLLERDGRLLIESEVSVQEGPSVLAPPAPLDEERLPLTVIRYVSRTRQNLLLQDASTEPPFATDPSIVRRRSRSVLCMPIAHQGQLQGVLYLENTLSPFAFSAERVDLLGVLCAQLAISLENARLYEDLERRVEERTRDLASAQARMVELEKAATEAQLTGGFAHEMRNALASAKLLLTKVAGPGLCAENARHLKDLYLRLKELVPGSEMGPIVDHLRSMHRNEEQIDAAFRDTLAALERALSTTRQLLEYARIGRDQRGGRRISIPMLCKEILNESSDDLATHGITVDLDIAHSAQLIGREEHFYSILKNLVLNARDALVEKKGSSDRRLRITFEQGPEGVALRVKDTGIGMAPDIRERIFEPLFSTKPATGTGLGLSVVRKLVALYDGSIEVESEAGTGTTVSITLPRTRVASRPFP